MRLRLRSLAERLRANLFFVPMVAVIVAILVGITGLALLTTDRALVRAAYHRHFPGGAST